MNVHKITTLVGATTLTFLLGTGIGLAQTAGESQAQPMHHGMMQQQTVQSQEAEGGMPDKCKAMMEKKQQMMQKCKMMDARLDELVAAMNTATGQQKIDAMAALLNELVQQRKSMHEMMMNMQGGMMHGKMQGGMMQGEMSQGKKPKCKMMQKMMQQQTETAPEAGGSGK